MTDDGKTPAKVIRWEIPPPAKRFPISATDPSRWSDLAEDLRDHPWQWAVIYEGTANGASSVASQVRDGRVSCFCPRGAFEAVTRSDGRVVRTYARYLGE